MLELPDHDFPALGVFVTLRQRRGDLRGCVGSIAPAEATLRRETARSAVLAATRDPRFAPVCGEELRELSVEVSVLGAEEPVPGPEALDPARFGVIVRDEAGRRGLLLPSVAGIDDAQTQIAIARRKAAIAKGAEVKLFRFTVDKWSDTLR